MSRNHYRHFHSGDKKCWIHKEDYLNFWHNKICQLLNIKQTDFLLDFACGKGEITRNIASDYNLKGFNLVDAFYGDDLVVKADGIEYLKQQSREQFDKVLIKQAVHHFYPESLDVLLKELRRVIKKEGMILILTMPDKLDYPSFQKLNELYISHPFKLSVLEKYASQSFELEKEKIVYEKEIPKNDFFDSFRERFISTLSELSDDEIEKGILEMDSVIDSNTLIVRDSLMAYKLFAK